MSVDVKATNGDAVGAGRRPVVEAGVASAVTRRRGRGAAAAVVIVYLLATALTGAFFMADTADYVESVLRYERGANYYFWEFGHLYWRPLGWLLLRAAGPLAQLFVGDDARLKTTFLLVAFNWAAGLACVVLLYGLLGRVLRRAWLAAGVTCAFIGAQGFLNYAQAGAAYTPGLACLLAGLYLLARASDDESNGGLLRSRRVQAALGGACLGAAVCFWVMYLWALPAALATPLLLFAPDRRRARVCLWAAVGCAALVGASYAAVLAVLRIDTVAELREWIRWSAHGNTTRGVMRMVFGFARSFVNMGQDGMLFKRFLLEDPHNPVTLWALVRLSLWKFALFYLSLLAASLALLGTPRGRRVLLWLAAGAPVLLFAVFFDGGAVERYLPLYPFVFVTLAVALADARAPRVLKLVVLLFVAVMAGGNAVAMSRWSLARQERRAEERVSELQPRLRPASRVYVVTWLDELVNFHRSFPFHPLNARESLRVDSLVTPGTDQAARWRGDFAAQTLKAWAAGGDVWLSTRAFAPAPRADWNWVEGDDPSVRWADFPEFFRPFEFGETAGGADGFRRLLPSAHNEGLLRPLAASGQVAD